MALTAAHLPAQPQRGIPYNDIWKIVGVSEIYETSGPSYAACTLSQDQLLGSQIVRRQSQLLTR